MNDRLVVDVLDEDGDRMEAEPRLVAEDETEVARVSSGASMDLSSVFAGDYQLRVRPPNHPALDFAVSVTLTDGVRTVSFVGGTPRCCALSRQRATAGDASSATTTSIVITLTREHSEVVFVAGFDYDDGNREYIKHAQFWRDDLYAGRTGLSGKWKTIPRVIFDHTVVTNFDVPSGHRIRQIKARGGGWHVMSSELQGREATWTAMGRAGSRQYEENKTRRRAGDSLSMVHVYASIEALGGLAPGSLKRFDYFGHAWHGGPLLINTFERDEYRAGARAIGTRPAVAAGSLFPLRDPLDKDGRASKDFHPDNSNVAQFKAAFAKDAGVQIWGCNYQQNLRDLRREAVRARDPDRPIGTSGVFTAKTFLEFMSRYIDESYPAKLAKAADRTVIAMPPGLGTRFGGVRNRYQRLTISAPSEYRFWAKEHDLQEVDGGFVLYEP